MVDASSPAPAASQPKELYALVDLLCAVVSAVKSKIASGGKFGIADLSTVMALVPQISPAFSNIQAVPGEIESMALADEEALVSYVVGKLGIADQRTIGMLQSGVSAASGVYSFIKALQVPAVAAAPAPATGAVAQV